jgi:hypothetical protein
MLMFGLFKKKQPALPERGAALNDVAQGMLAAQFALAQVGPEVAATRNWSMGYMFGIHDAVYQRARISGDVECIALMSVSFIGMFGGVNAGSTAIRRCLDLQADPEFVAGSQAGGGDVFQFFADTNRIPMALFTYLQEVSGVA